MLVNHPQMDVVKGGELAVLHGIEGAAVLAANAIAVTTASAQEKTR
ncbi:MAG: hypothetical protein JJD98_12105 [Polaromonas sp.]|nr:hypothetical protein [Polaromonas sp.]